MDLMGHFFAMRLCIAKLLAIKRKKGFVEMEQMDCVRGWMRRFSVTFKLAIILGLVLALLIPLGMIGSLLKERMMRRDEAVANITNGWGGAQEVIGPVLVVPYHYKVKTKKETTVQGRTVFVDAEETATGNIYVLPAALNIDGALSPSVRHRGIYDAIVYKGKLEMSGNFQPPDLDDLGIAASDVVWTGAMVTMAVSDLRGTTELPAIAIGDRTCAFKPGSKLTGYTNGVYARLAGGSIEGKKLDYKLSFDIKGSQGISFAPVGQHNRVQIKSEWSDPSFRGAFLPSDRTVNDKGFAATWEMTGYGRNYPQQSTDRGGLICSGSITPSLFGVDFMNLIDSYRLVERATKYGALFMVLIFGVFFLFEIMARLRIHAIQYTLIGAALCLFYLALLSLSEFLDFRWAYLVGSGASLLLIACYSLSVLKSGKRTLIIAAALAAVYAYLYVVLQLQNYSLLFGTAGLFIVLGIIMYATRNVDWLTRDLTAESEAKS